MLKALLITALLITPITGCVPSQIRESDPVVHENGVYARGVVAADHAIASKAGAQMLAMGGNAVDAAVAASFTLSVVRPYSCGIGGGGFMLVHLPDDPTHGRVHTAINYREQAYVDPGYYERTNKSSTTGGAAVAIPGTVAGLLYALEHHVDRLAEDHANTRRLAEGLTRLGFRVDPPPETNMVMFDFEDTLAFVGETRARHLLINPTGPGRFRAVTHLDVSTSDLEETLERLGEALEEIRS